MIYYRYIGKNASKTMMHFDILNSVEILPLVVYIWNTPKI